MRLRMKLKKAILCASAVFLASFAQAASGEAAEAVISLEDLPAACKNARSEFRPIDRDDVQQSKAGLIEALSRLDRRLELAGSNGEDWRKYLRWDALQAELRGDQPDKALLGSIHARYCAGYEGLDLVWFLDVQRALHNYIAMLRAVDNPNIRAGFEAIIDRLAASMKTYVAKPTTEDALVISESVRWLEGAHQCPALVRAIQSHFVRPNLFVEISAEVVAAGLDEGVDDTMPIRDYILGTDIHGTAHTVGRTHAELWPDPKFGVIDALFFGVTESDNVGYHGGITIFSRSTTNLAARKRIWIDAGGLSSYPAVSKAETSISFNDIQSRRGRRLIERMAWRKAGKQQSLAECIASQHAEEKLNKRIDQQAVEPLERANRQYVEKYQRPFTERKLFPRRLDFSTTPSALRIIGLQAGESKLAAPDEPPSVVEGAEMSLRIHESTINNLVFDALAGRTVYEEKVQQAAADLLGELPEKMKGDEDGQPWAITFAPRQPISVTFADQRLTITLRGVKYYKGDDAHPAMNVSAVYKIEKSPKGFKLVRQGNIVVLPPDFIPGGGRTIDARRTVIRKLLEIRFEKVFEPEFLAEGFEPSGKWKALGRMMPIQMDCQNGWLTIAWKRAAR